MLGFDGQDAFLQLQGDVLLLETGQLRLQQEFVALVPNVGAEGGQAGVGVAEELFLKVVKHVKQVVVATVKGNHTKHHETLLFQMIYSGRTPAETGPTGFIKFAIS